jgi:hypothetical protein
MTTEAGAMALAVFFFVVVVEKEIVVRKKTEALSFLIITPCN